MGYYVGRNRNNIYNKILGGGDKMYNFIVILYVAYYLMQGIMKGFTPFTNIFFSKLYAAGWTIGTLKIAMWELKYDGLMDFVILSAASWHLCEFLYRETKRG